MDLEVQQGRSHPGVRDRQVAGVNWALACQVLREARRVLVDQVGREVLLVRVRLAERPDLDHRGIQGDRRHLKMRTK